MSDYLYAFVQELLGFLALQTLRETADPAKTAATRPSLRRRA